MVRKYWALHLRVTLTFSLVQMIGQANEIAAAPATLIAKEASSHLICCGPRLPYRLGKTAFTHANVGRLTRHKCGFEVLWSELTGKRRLFPLESLIVLPETLTQFVREERN